MPIDLTAVARTTTVTTWEGEHDGEIDWTIAPTDDPSVAESHELYTSLGGWPIAWNMFSGSLLGAGPVITGITTTSAA